MEFIKYIAQEWEIVSGAPVEVIILMFIAATVGFLVARFRYGKITDLADQRRQLSEEQNKKLAAEIQEFRNLASSQTSLEELRKKIDSMPRIFTGPNPPPTDSLHEGDIWLQTE